MATKTKGRSRRKARTPVRQHLGPWARDALGIVLEGFTWAERFLVASTPFDFAAVMPGLCEVTYFADPEEWCNCFKVAADGPPGLWRTVYPTDPKIPEAELMSEAAVQARLQKFFPKEGSYDVEYVNVYSVSQRVAASFRKGRVLLAGGFKDLARTYLPPAGQLEQIADEGVRNELAAFLASQQETEAAQRGQVTHLVPREHEAAQGQAQTRGFLLAGFEFGARRGLVGPVADDARDGVGGAARRIGHWGLVIKCHCGIGPWAFARVTCRGVFAPCSGFAAGLPRRRWA